MRNDSKNCPYCGSIHVHKTPKKMIPIEKKEDKRIISTDSLAEAICEILSDSSMAKLFSEKARLDFMEKYEQNKFIEAMGKIYNNL